MPNNDVIEILFGVKGGGVLSGESGKKIHSELTQIAEQISLKINIDQKYFHEQLLKLKSDLDKTLGDLKIRVVAEQPKQPVGGSSPVGAGNKNKATEQQKKTFSELIKLYKEYITLQSKANVTPTANVKFGDNLAETYQKQAAVAQVAFAKLRDSLGDDSLTTEQKQALNELIKEYNALLVKQQEVYSAKQSEKYANSTITGYDKVISKGEQLYSTYNYLITHNKEAKAAYDALKASMSQPLSSNPEEAAEQLRRLKEQVNATSATLGKLNIQSDTLGNKIRKAFETGIVQKFSYALLALAMNAIRKVYQNVVNLDKAMTDLRIVTRATTKQYKEFSTNVAKTAREIGASVEDLIRSTTTFARLGYSLKEAQELAKLTTQYSNTSGVSVSDATTNITGILKAFDLGADDLEDVLDRIIYIGNNYAISQAEIGEAMNNTASALAANGNSLQEAMGILTAANVTMQNVSKSSTAVRTISARIARSTSELDELGEDSGTVLSTSSLDKKIRGITNGLVTITDNQGELRSTYDILSDLASVWDKLSSTEQASIANDIAGTRQQAAFYSIMQNWGDAESIVASQGAAYGSLEKANEEYVNSIQGHLNQINATWEEFSKNMLNSNLVKFVLNIVQGIANLLNGLSKIGDGLLVQIPLIGVALSAIYAILVKIKGTQIWSSFISGLKKVFAPITKLIAAIKQKAAAHRDGANAAREEAFAEEQAASTMENASNKTAISAGSILASIATVAAALGIIWTIMEKGDKWVSWVVLVGAIIVGVIAGIGLAVKISCAVADKSIKAFMASNPIGWILGLLTAIVSLVMAIINLCKQPSYEDLKEEAEDAKSAWSEFNNTLKETKNKLEEVNEQIAELQSKIDNNEPLTLVEEKQLAALKQAQITYQQMVDAQQDAANIAAADAQKKVKAALDKYNRDNKSRVVSFLTKANKNSWGSLTSAEKKAISDYMAEVYDNLDEFEYDTPEYDKNGNIIKGLESWQLAINDYWDEYFTMLDRVSIAKGDYATAWESATSRIKFSSAIKALKEYANEAHVTSEGIGELVGNNQDVKEFVDYLNSIGLWEGNASFVEQVKQLADGLIYVTKEKYADQLNEFTDAFDALSGALKDVADNGIIANETIKEMLKEYPNLTEKFFNLTDQGYQLKPEFADMSTNEVLRLYAIEGLQEYVDEYERCQKELEEHGDDDFAEQAIENAANAQENLNTAISTYATLLRTAEFDALKDALEKQKDALEDQFDVYNELIELRKELLSTYEEEVNYKNELNKKQAAVADLQTQLSLAQLDNSASGQARARRLQSQLDEAKEELNSFTLEKAIDRLQDYLDADSQEYEAFINQKVAELQETIENLAKNFKLEIDTSSEPITITPTYHQGGFVGGVTKLKSNEEFAKLLEGERVSTPAQMDTFMRKTLPAIAAGGGGAVIQNNSPLIELNCGNVTENTLPELKNIVNQAVEKIEKNMANALSRTGYKKKN